MVWLFQNDHGIGTDRFGHIHTYLHTYIHNVFLCYHFLLVNTKAYVWILYCISFDCFYCCDLRPRKRCEASRVCRIHMQALILQNFIRITVEILGPSESPIHLVCALYISSNIPIFFRLSFWHRPLLILVFFYTLHNIGTYPICTIKYP